MFSLRISKTVDNKYNLCQTSLKYKSKKVKLDRFKWLSYSNKLDNNITRARSSIFNIVSYNRFKFFYTQTINSIYARNDLKLLINKLSQITRDLRKKYPNLSFFYLVIPEYHKDKKNWHLHGFLSEGYEVDSYVNKNGYISVKSFDKIGFNSVSEIKYYTACSKYITKYMNKNNFDIKKGERLYYCTNGLKRDNVINSLVISQIAPVHFDFKNQFVFKSMIDENKYYNFITRLDYEKRLNYYFN